MNIRDLQQKLIAAARAAQPSDAVPYAFEKRVISRLRSAPLPMDLLSFWAQGLWRAAASCVALLLVLGLCSIFGLVPSNSGRSPDLETAILAPFNNLDTTW